MFDARELLAEMVRLGASDLVLTVGAPPQMRVHGLLTPWGDRPLSRDDTRQLAQSFMQDRHWVSFDERGSADLAASLDDTARFRVHVFKQQGAVALAIRQIATQIPPFEALGLPASVRDFAMAPFGLVLITGPAGSGKSTTLAALIDHINHHRQGHVICLEDPIEYVHRHRRCTIEQIEIGEDAPTFAEALRNVFRQTPDVIMVGEMRDRETIALALTLAETGHLILATLHTQDTANAINRVVDTFPADQQQQILMQLSMTLVGICSQQLLIATDHRRRVLACEVLKANSAIRNLIREGAIQQIYSVLQIGRGEGMQTMEDSLWQLHALGLITEEQAMSRSGRPKEMQRLLQTRGRSGGREGTTR
ncbi:MAG: PilT/PilU family type 4a pilus ATPase [Kiritimatiellae bacterium]|nr:PilT/PilU family type 4a pilus ATPase [Kiritimatiellia bacterium]